MGIITCPKCHGQYHDVVCHECPHCKRKEQAKEESEEQVMEQGTKKCPFCAEDIKREAIVCRFCGRDLSPDQTKPLQEVKEEKGGCFWVAVIAGGIIVAVIVLSYG
jgi:NAD-dependent SIR2 family protein deacetylase